MVILKLLLYLFVLVLVVFLAYYTTIPRSWWEKAQGENSWARASMSWNGQA
ncbi:hypothetical protein [Eisenbergiella tayi]|uniref:hypothetical protein n=1 Tax=Eisenbergiella tayi TaxID=1432052 RepID=UPI0014960B64|nr:hypothetical protein [Eisenbergiella tayi]